MMDGTFTGVYGVLTLICFIVLGWYFLALTCSIINDFLILIFKSLNKELKRLLEEKKTD